MTPTPWPRGHGRHIKTMIQGLRLT